MKTLKTFAAFVLTSTIALVPLSSALALDFEIDRCRIRPFACGGRGLDPDIARRVRPRPDVEAPARPSPPREVHHYHDDDDGAVWGALAGGTVLGVVMSSMANQPSQDTQATVVVVQQPDGYNARQRQSLQQEIEEERARQKALEEEIRRIRADGE